MSGYGLPSVAEQIHTLSSEYQSCNPVFRMRVISYLAQSPIAKTFKSFDDFLEAADDMVYWLIEEVEDYKKVLEELGEFVPEIPDIPEGWGTGDSYL